ncbi:MAG: NAD(P)/FAD-dependent oxidoreductase [Deltaproteobacteria bacterium]|jgi:cation diffusion facilitator CzcD-associated flavoprotein CzcO|nr:NAD(P)/FAD-dependent oxidoreductase [Deltaproteobacteria bacterium]
MADFDVVIVGAGLSGIGAAYHLQRDCPSKSYAIVESRDAIGGTWDLHRYPGIRSDSDMHTLGYGFKPWIAEQAIADGPSILEYVNETADENDIREHILFGRKVESASWSSHDATWTLRIGRSDAEDATTGEETISCRFLLMCSGYYSYESPHRPHFEGEEDFEGAIFHPQLWPGELDYRGKRVVVIGSGATAMTLVPAMADDVEHIVMLQRSPTYVISRPDVDVVANILRRILPEKLAYRITRFKNAELQRRLYEKTRRSPDKVKAFLLGDARKRLRPDYDFEKHFTPKYDPWDQRLCLIPNADLFEAINSGKASVVTDQIDRLTKKGIRLASGEELEADIIIVATGLKLKVLGGVRLSVDNVPVQLADTWTYKGMMYSDVPNLVQTFGYVNASWTLRADLTAEYVCRLLNRMDELGMRQCTPRLREEDRGMAKRPWLDDFSAGYVQRAMHLFPKQGDHEPWLNTQSYAADKKMIRRAPLEDGVLLFGNPETES